MASTRTSTYSPSDVNVVISQESTGLIHAIAGYAEDSHINVERDSETYEHVTGVDNIATRVYKANTSGKVTVSLGQGSASNDILTMLYLNDKASKNSDGLFTLTVKDGSGRSVAFAQEAYIGVVPNSQYGNSLNNRDWVFHCTQMDDIIGGNSLISPEDVAAIQLLGGVVPSEWQA